MQAVQLIQFNRIVPLFIALLLSVAASAEEQYTSEFTTKVAPEAVEERMSCAAESGEDLLAQLFVPSIALTPAPRSQLTSGTSGNDPCDTADCYSTYFHCLNVCIWNPTIKDKWACFLGCEKKLASCLDCDDD